jgi:hypothetical protein
MNLSEVIAHVVVPILTLTGAGALSYFILKYWREQKQQANSLQWQQIQVEKQRNTLNLRLQAYERMLLLCERIAIPNLIMRLRTEGATANDLRLAMLIGIQQEFEHNVTQQIYVSENLWNILRVARDNTAEIINIATEKIDAKGHNDALVAEIFKILSEQTSDSLAKAQSAIRQEAASLL